MDCYDTETTCKSLRAGNVWQVTLLPSFYIQLRVFLIDSFQCYGALYESDFSIQPIYPDYTRAVIYPLVKCVHEPFGSMKWVLANVFYCSTVNNRNLSVCKNYCLPLYCPSTHYSTSAHKVMSFPRAMFPKTHEVTTNNF